MDGSVVDIQPTEKADSEPQIRYASDEEVFEAYERTLPQHDATYRELAKGPEGVGPHDPPPFDSRKW